MRIPTVHINGTSGSDLLSQVTFASLAVEHAIDKLREAWPNARDYYTQIDEAWGECLNEWNTRLDKLVEVKTELDRVAEGIGRQIPGPDGELPW